MDKLETLELLQRLKINDLNQNQNSKQPDRPDTV